MLFSSSLPHKPQQDASALLQRTRGAGEVHIPPLTTRPSAPEAQDPPDDLDERVRRIGEWMGDW